MSQGYRGRIAPSPTGYLHLGHAATFWTAHARARAAGGTILLRNENLDTSRCREEFVSAMLEDLRWLGIEWDEGPDIGGPCGPYDQSARRPFYIDGWSRLLEAGFIYPCSCSRKEVFLAAGAPHAGDEEPVYNGACRPSGSPGAASATVADRAGIAWRFRVPDGEAISFHDGGKGEQRFVAGRDFGDFVIWRKDDMPAYQLAVVLDDHEMGITEVVRGADLLLSTARQILIYRALQLPMPRFYHCPLITDEHGNRLAKRHDALNLRTLRQQRKTPAQVRQLW